MSNSTFVKDVCRLIVKESGMDISVSHMKKLNDTRRDYYEKGAIESSSDVIEKVEDIFSDVIFDSTKRRHIRQGLARVLR